MQPRRAGIYLRISLDQTGQRLGVTRQRRDCEAKARDRGWTVTQIYEDNDTSAFAKRRPAYEQLLADLEAGAINAVIVWDLDRLTRRPIEIEHFIDLADRTGCALASVGGDVDLSTDNGRLFARIKGAVARAEVERKSTRMKAANIQRAEAGKPPAGGIRLFGYELGGQVVVEEEALLLKQAAEQLLAGGTVHGIVRWLNEQGSTSTRGGPWHPMEFRRIIANPRLAALRRYRGEIVARGTWPPILDEDTHHAIKALLADPARHKAGPPRKYLLSGIGRCGVCGQRLFGATDGPKGWLYRCESRAHVSRRAEPVEDYVVAVLLERVAAGELERPPSPAPKPADDDELLRARLNGLSEAFAVGDIDRLQLQAGTRRLRARLEALSAARGASVSRSPLRPLLDAEDPWVAWGAMPFDVQRAIISAGLQVVIHPPGRGAKRFNPDTVQITTISSSATPSPVVALPGARPAKRPAARGAARGSAGA